MVVISVHNSVEVILKFWWESGFLRGSMEPLLYTNGSAWYHMQLSVKALVSRLIFWSVNLLKGFQL